MKISEDLLELYRAVNMAERGTASECTVNTAMLKRVLVKTLDDDGELIAATTEARLFRELYHRATAAPVYVTGKDMADGFVTGAKVKRRKAPATEEEDF